MAETDWPGEQLVLAAQRGDVDSISALVSGSYPHVLRFAHSLCTSPHDAEDAAQEALIILYRRIGMLRATAALGSWMFRIVRNECLRRARTVLRSAEPDREAATECLEDDVLRRLEAERVAAVIAALPEDLRRVLIMRDVQGRPGRPVAEELGLTTAAMKSRLHRARTAVREGLRQPLDGYEAGRDGSGGAGDADASDHRPREGGTHGSGR
ncbi:RNA polymerase sigma factor [Embleya sp. NPDC050154]|uniref:RNA polymerase sigma factor n=1 Tax=Embleya sp. NPDC050154 TaxID=3363988 RepID=UPI0037AF460F